jgi:hypothetical protein
MLNQSCWVSSLPPNGAQALCPFMVFFSEKVTGEGKWAIAPHRIVAHPNTQALSDGTCTRLLSRPGIYSPQGSHEDFADQR